MRIRAIGSSAVVAAALALLLAGLGAGSTRHTSLRLVKPAPLQLVGTGFRARERVRVVASAAQASVTQRVRASIRGTFAVSFPFSAGHCSGLRVVAVGNAASRATLKRPPLPACMLQ